jgi:hypothetical protein
MSEVFASCGIRIDRAQLAIVQSPTGAAEIDSPYGGRDLTLARQTPAIPKPIIYFVGEVKSGDTGWSGAEYWVGSNALLNTAWLSSAILSPVYKRNIQPGYSTAAHELAHLLTNSEHVRDGSHNILGADRYTANDRITPQQCAMMKRSRLVTPLPTRKFERPVILKTMSGNPAGR